VVDDLLGAAANEPTAATPVRRTRTRIVAREAGRPEIAIGSSMDTSVPFLTPTAVKPLTVED
jgi:hypothetical protein